MKKKFRFFLVFIIAVFFIRTGKCQLQNYFTDGSRWVYETNESTEPNIQLITNSIEQYSIQGDTLINLVSFKKLYNKKVITTILNPTTIPNYIISYDSSLQYIRFDSLSNQVYFRTDTSLIDNLVYSFSPALGDTLNGIYSGSNYIVDSILPINLFGAQASKYLISQPSPWNFIDYENYLIDGIGSSNGLLVFHPVQIVLSGGIFMTRLVCFQHEDSIYYGFNRIDCPLINFSTSIKNFQKDIRIIISPNPFYENLNIYTDKYITNGQIKIFNVMGRIVYQDEFIGSNKTINFNFPSGIYFIQIKGPDISHSQKLIR